MTTTPNTKEVAGVQDPDPEEKTKRKNTKNTPDLAPDPEEKIEKKTEEGPNHPSDPIWTPKKEEQSLQDGKK